MQDDLTHLALIVDRSGSMHPNRHATCDAVNELMSAQQREPGRMLVDLVLFNEHIDVVYVDRDVSDFELLVPDVNYRPGGITALLDAVGSTIDRLGKRLADMDEADRPGKVMVVVQTDGLENASSDYDAKRIIEMRRHQEDAYGWAFLFLGADQDAWSNNLGVAAANTVSYASADPQAGFAAATAAVSGYRSGTRSAVNLTGTDKGVDTRSAARNR